MARGGGSIQPGGVYHVISRFVAKQWFIEGEHERRVYLEMLGTALGETDWRLLSYALMSSHIHLAFVAGSTPLATWMRSVHTQFAQWVNKRHERIGAVFVKGPNVIDLRP